MPVKSKAQWRYFQANREKLKAQGVNFKEWFDGASYDKLPEKAAEGVPGGLADGKPDSMFSPLQLAKGQKVEKEHTKDPAVAKDITKDHLVENPRYYTHLEKMERSMKAAAVLPSARVSGEGAPPRGDEMRPLMPPNPFANTDPDSAIEFENGYEFAQEVGVQGFARMAPEDMLQWKNTDPAWRQGFVEGVTRMGREDLVGPLAEKTALVTVDGHPIPMDPSDPRNGVGITAGSLRMGMADQAAEEHLQPGVRRRQLAGSIGGTLVGAGLGAALGTLGEVENPGFAAILGALPGKFVGSAVGRGLGNQHLDKHLIPTSDAILEASKHLPLGLRSTLQDPETGEASPSQAYHAFPMAPGAGFAHLHSISNDQFEATPMLTHTTMLDAYRGKTAEVAPGVMTAELTSAAQQKRPNIKPMLAGDRPIPPHMVGIKVPGAVPTYDMDKGMMRIAGFEAMARGVHDAATQHTLKSRALQLGVPLAGAGLAMLGAPYLGDLGEAGADLVHNLPPAEDINFGQLAGGVGAAGLGGYVAHRMVSGPGKDPLGLSAVDKLKSFKNPLAGF